MKFLFGKVQVCTNVDVLDPGLYFWTPWFAFGISNFETDLGEDYRFTLHNFGVCLVVCDREISIPKRIYINEEFLVYCDSKKLEPSYTVAGAGG
jgi:hypothetical protein